MSQNCAVIAFSTRKGPNKFADPRSEIVRETKDCPELNDHGIHLPVAVCERYVQQMLGNPQMRRRADRQKFRESFHDAQQKGQQVVVQNSSEEAASFEPELLS